MKIKIFRNEKRKVKEREDYKTVFELILFAFSMCAVTILLIFGTYESKGVKENNEEEMPVFKENGIYEIFDLELLKNTKITDGVSDFQLI